MASPTDVHTRRGASPTASPNGHMLTVSQTAEMLGVHPNSVRRWADMDLIRSHRLGCRGDRRFMREDVQDFLVAWKRRQPSK